MRQACGHPGHGSRSQSLHGHTQGLSHIFRSHLAPPLAKPAGTFRGRFRLWGQRPLHCTLYEPGSGLQVSACCLWILHKGVHPSGSYQGFSWGVLSRGPITLILRWEALRLREVRRLIQAHATSKNRAGIQGDLFPLSISV